MTSTTIAALGTNAVTKARPNKTRVPELDGLRGIAIAAVLIVHYFYFAPGPAHQSSVWVSVYAYLVRTAALGWSGVDLFFVLSGFLIGGILLDARASTNYFKTFYARRAFRILPIYYAWIGTYFIVMALAGRLFETRVPGGGAWETGSTIAAQLLFLQNLRPLHYAVIGGAWFAPTWSLAVEEQFYLIAPAVIRLLTRRRLYLGLVLVILLAPVFRSYVRYHFPIHDASELSLAYMLMPCRADALAVGVLTALLWRNQSFRARLDKHGRILLVAVVTFLFGLAALTRWAPNHDSWVEQSVGYTWIAIFYALVLLLVLSKPRGWLARFMRIAWLRELGKVSYCVYLIHLAVAIFCQMLLMVVPQPVRAPAWRAAALIVCYVIARASWTYFENPLLKRGHGYEYKY